MRETEDSDQKAYEEAIGLWNRIALMLLQKPEGVTISEVASVLNIEREKLYRWLRGKGQIGRFLKGRFVLEKTGNRIRIRFPERYEYWFAALWKLDGSLEFKKYGNEILDALFDPSKAQIKADEYLHPLPSGRLISFIRQGDELFAFFPIQESTIKIGSDGRISFDPFAAGNDASLIFSLTNLRESSWRLVSIHVISCDKKILEEAKRRGGALTREIVGG
jgi:hypothetical protein